MHRRFATLCLLLTSSAICAQQPAQSDASVKSLVEQLASREYRRREFAAKQLESLGPDALPALRRALETTRDAEARGRLNGLIERLERAAILSPKRLTIVMNERPVAEIIREISRQSGYPMQYQGGAGKQVVSLNRTNATFWEVMDDLSRMTGVTMYHNEGQGLVVFDQEGHWPHSVLHGPFRIVANNVHYQKTLQLGPLSRNLLQNQLRSESLTLAFQVFSEPKLPILGAGQPRLIEAIDEAGNSMKPATLSHEAMYATSYGGYRMYQIGSTVMLNWPDQDVRLVKRLQVSLPLTLLAEQRPLIVIDNILQAKDKKVTQGGIDLTVREVKEINKSQFHVSLTVRNMAPNAAQDFTWTNSVHQRIELLDAKGNRYSSQGYNWENVAPGPGSVQAVFMFGSNGAVAVGPPARLVYYDWSVIQHTIEFQFRDLPLP
jgi:hypothetical protein